MSEWQTIDSAPRDGSWYLTCRQSEGVESYEIGCFHPSFDEMFVAVGGGLYRKEKYSMYDYRGFNNHHRATHWMPLPGPPK